MLQRQVAHCLDCHAVHIVCSDEAEKAGKAWPIWEPGPIGKDCPFCGSLRVVAEPCVEIQSCTFCGAGVPEPVPVARTMASLRPKRAKGKARRRRRPVPVTQEAAVVCEWSSWRSVDCREAMHINRPSADMPRMVTFSEMELIAVVDVNA